MQTIILTDAECDVLYEALNEVYGEYLNDMKAHLDQAMIYARGTDNINMIEWSVFDLKKKEKLYSSLCDKIPYTGKFWEDDE